jgi:hypothetical protein
MDWLEEELGGFEDDYLIFDCPGVIRPLSACRCVLINRTGQIELYTHHPFLPTLVQNLSRLGIRTCAAYLIESQFMEDRYKFFRYVLNYERLNSSSENIFYSGVLSAMSAMVNLEIPWINIMSKMDLVTSNADEPAGGARNGIRSRKNIARYVLSLVRRFGDHLLDSCVMP